MQERFGPLECFSHSKAAFFCMQKIMFEILIEQSFLLFFWSTVLDVPTRFSGLQRIVTTWPYVQADLPEGKVV